MRLLETLTQQLNIHCASSHAISSSSCDVVANSVPESNNDSESGNTFLTWVERWKDTLTKHIWQIFIATTSIYVQIMKNVMQKNQIIT